MRRTRKTQHRRRCVTDSPPLSFGLVTYARRWERTCLEMYGHNSKQCKTTIPILQTNCRSFRYRFRRCHCKLPAPGYLSGRRQRRQRQAQRARPRRALSGRGGCSCADRHPPSVRDPPSPGPPEFFFVRIQILTTDAVLVVSATGALGYQKEKTEPLSEEDPKIEKQNET